MFDNIIFLSRHITHARYLSITMAASFLLTNASCTANKTTAYADTVVAAIQCKDTVTLDRLTETKGEFDFLKHVDEITCEILPDERYYQDYKCRVIKLNTSQAINLKKDNTGYLSAEYCTYVYDTGKVIIVNIK
jgi:hypothetical protein